MVHYCCVYDCKNNSTCGDYAFHGFPDDQKLVKIWISRIKRDPAKDFKITKSTKVCSAHFTEQDYISTLSQKKKLKLGVCPSVFSWSKKRKKRSLPAKRAKIQEQHDLMEAELTATASEGEGEYDTNCDNGISRGIQTDLEIPCSHRFSVDILKSLCDSPKKEAKYFSHFTGFKSYDRFRSVLEFVLPDLDRSHIVNWDSKAAKKVRIDANFLFDSDPESAAQSESSQESEDEELVTNSQRRTTLSVEDEYFLVLMKLRLGLTNVDLSIRFYVSEATVSKLFSTWMNYLYLRLGTLKIWPHRNILINSMPAEFKQQYPNTVVIIDATELRIQTPSSLLRQSQSYSNYKSTNTLKSLIGVDPKGGIIFISQLYTGSVSDKEIVQRSGFLDILSDKVNNGEIQANDCVIADKGFDIEEDLKKINLCLNIPPFLGDQTAFTESDVIKTQTIAKHRIHIERAIGKVRRFQIFSNEIPVNMFGIINQIWTVCCALSNFMEPILK